MLEERKQELVGLITKEQDDKLKRVRGLIRRHGDDLEAAVTLVESAIRSLEEPHMCVFVQVGSDRLCDYMVFPDPASSSSRFLSRAHPLRLVVVYRKPKQGALLATLPPQSPWRTAGSLVLHTFRHPPVHH